MVKNVEVIGGYVQGDDENGNGVFIVKRSEVVPEDKLAAFFRRDWEMCSMPKIKLANTNKEPTVLF